MCVCPICVPIPYVCVGGVLLASKYKVTTDIRFPFTQTQFSGRKYSFLILYLTIFVRIFYVEIMVGGESLIPKSEPVLPSFSSIDHYWFGAMSTFNHFECEDLHWIEKTPAESGKKTCSKFHDRSFTPRRFGPIKKPERSQHDKNCHSYRSYFCAS